MGSWKLVVTQKAVLVDSAGPSPAGSRTQSDDGDEVLLVRDASDGDWEFPGGKVDRGERAVESLGREVREETGLDPTIERPVFTATKRRTKKRGKFFVYYRGRVEGRAVTLSDEHDEYAWLPPTDARARLNRRRRRALDRAVE